METVCMTTFLFLKTRLAEENLVLRRPLVPSILHTQIDAVKISVTGSVTSVADP